MPTLSPDENPPELAIKGRSSTSLPARKKDSRWALIYTRSRQEKVLARQLLQAKQSYYLPYKTYEGRAANRPITVQQPLFQGYLFAYGPPIDLVDALNGNDSPAKNVVSTQWVKDETLLRQDLRRLWAFTHAVNTRFQRLAKAQPGQLLTFTEGPFEGMTATLITPPSSETHPTVQLNIHMLGAAEFTIDLSNHTFDLGPIQPNPSASEVPSHD